MEKLIHFQDKNNVATHTKVFPTSIYAEGRASIRPGSISPALLFNDTKKEQSSFVGFSDKDISNDFLEIDIGNALGRLKYTRALDSQIGLNSSEVIASYLEWKKKRCLLVFETPECYKFQYAAKRGNKLYAERIKEKWKDFEVIETTPFFNIKDRGPKKTKMLHITLTNKCKEGLRSSWLNVGKEFNRFLSALKSKYGPLVCARCWEAFESGYPHIHVVIYFDSYDFDVFKDKKGSFRIKEKNNIAKLWNAFIDVKACYDTDVLFYLAKHTVKFCLPVKLKNRNQVITLAYCWIYQKRSFSISRDFFNRVHKYGLYNSNLRAVQSPLKSETTEIKFIGIAFLGENDFLEWKEGYTHVVSKQNLPLDIEFIVNRAREWKELRDFRRENPLTAHRSRFGAG